MGQDGGDWALEDDSNFNTTEFERDEVIMSFVIFISAYCVYAMCKHLKYTGCIGLLSMCKDLVCDDDAYRVNASAGRGAVKYPILGIVIFVHYCYNLIKIIL